MKIFSRWNIPERRSEAKIGQNQCSGAPLSTFFYICNRQNKGIYANVHSEDIWDLVIVTFHARLACENCIKDSSFLITRVVDFTESLSWGGISFVEKPFFDKHFLTSFHQFLVPKFVLQEACSSKF